MKAHPSSLVFALAHPQIPGDSKTAVIGIGKESWEFMKDGMTHTLDLRPLGVELKIVLFGAPTRQADLDMIKQGAEMGGTPINDLELTDLKDFGIKEPKTN